MMILGHLDGQFYRFFLWTLGPGKPRLHFRDEKIEVETIGEIRKALEDRGVTNIRISGYAWETTDD